jgi:hypothetical protein
VCAGMHTMPRPNSDEAFAYLQTSGSVFYGALTGSG